MTSQPTQPEKLAEVVHLSLVLSQRVLAALVMKRAVSAGQAIALVQAARLLDDHDVEWPPLLIQVTHELAENARDATPTRSRVATIGCWSGMRDQRPIEGYEMLRGIKCACVGEAW